MKHKLYIILCLAIAGGAAVSQTTSPGAGGTTSGGTSVTQPGQATTGSGTLTPGQGPAATQPGAFIPPQVSSTGTRTSTGAAFQTNNQLGTTTNSASLTAQLPQNVNTAQLAARLAALQAEIQATLPLVASVSQGVIAVTTNQPIAGAYVGRSGLGNRAAVGQGSTVAPVPPPRGISPRSIPLQGSAAANQATVAAQTGMAGASTVTADAFRALVVLQTDMERMLPVLNALNQGGITSLSGTGASFGTTTGVQAQPQNRFGTQPGVGTRPPAGTPQGPFTPTGR